MTDKEKLEEAKRLYQTANADQRYVLERLLPELKEESEDERIRKELIDIVAKSPITFAFEDKNKVLSWLERQGEQTDKIVERAKTEKQIVLITESDGEANIDWDTRSLQDVKLLLEYGLDYVNKLEKQGEHKETLCDKCKKEQPSHSCQDITALGRCAVEHEQKTADKVYIPMSLDEAIEHCKKKSCDNTPCALEHKQLEKWLTELKELKEQKPAWSEEDEVKLQTCIDRLQAGSLMGKVDTVMTNWLKSLKERINGKQ